LALSCIAMLSFTRKLQATFLRSRHTELSPLWLLVCYARSFGAAAISNRTSSKHQNSHILYHGLLATVCDRCAHDMHRSCFSEAFRRCSVTMSIAGAQFAHCRTKEFRTKPSKALFARSQRAITFWRCIHRRSLVRVCVCAHGAQAQASSPGVKRHASAVAAAIDTPSSS